MRSIAAIGMAFRSTAPLSYAAVRDAPAVQQDQRALSRRAGRGAKAPHVDRGSAAGEVPRRNSARPWDDWFCGMIRTACSTVVMPWRSDPRP